MNALCSIPSKHRNESKENETDDQDDFARRKVEFGLNNSDVIMRATLRIMGPCTSPYSFTANAFKMKNIIRQKDTHMASDVSGNLKRRRRSDKTFI